MRLPLPAHFPDVDVPLETAATAVVSLVQTGMPGTELHVILANGYGMSLIHGRPGAYNGEHTVECQLAHFPATLRDTGYFRATGRVPGITTGNGPGLQGWATGQWLASALAVLAALPPRT
jgi:hypothetical protein